MSNINFLTANVIQFVFGTLTTFFLTMGMQQKSNLSSSQSLSPELVDLGLLFSKQRTILTEL